MIRKIIKEQLEKCHFANLNNYDAKNNIFIIPKFSLPTYELNKCYLVRIPLTIVNNNNSVLAVNWNQSSAPNHEYLKIYVSKILGKMIFVDSLAYDFNNKVDLYDMWSGWLNIDELTQIAAL